MEQNQRIRFNNPIPTSESGEIMKKVYCLYDDGSHIDCFPTFKEAEAFALDLSNRLTKYWEVEEEDYEASCDCGMNRFAKEPDYDAQSKDDKIDFGGAE